MGNVRLSRSDGGSEIHRNGFALPWHEFQPVIGKIFQQRFFKALSSC
jgi:hypothetical protein